MPPNQLIRRDVVELLTEVDAAAVGRPVTDWTYSDGRTVTAEDAAVLATATPAEARAAADLLLQYTLASGVADDAARRWGDLVEPYFAAHPECFTVEELLGYMTPADREELDGLAGVMRVTYKGS